MTQLSLDDAIQETASAIALVEHGAGDIWMTEALAVIARVAAQQPELSVNDVWAAGLSAPPCSRAIGAAMCKAREAKIIVSTGRWAPSLCTHMSPVKIWRSLRYGGAR